MENSQTQIFQIRMAEASLDVSEHRGDVSEQNTSALGQRLCLLSTLLQVVAREDEEGLETDGLAIPEHICQAILVELLELLAPLHACRKRHRYVRPWTVAITSGGRLELSGGKGFEDSRLSANSSAESMQTFVGLLYCKM